MKYRPDEIERFGLKPYAVYGGFVYSFKCPKVSGNRVYDAALLDHIFALACDAANKRIEKTNETEVVP